MSEWDGRAVVIAPVSFSARLAPKRSRQGTRRHIRECPRRASLPKGPLNVPARRRAQQPDCRRCPGWRGGACGCRHGSGDSRRLVPLHRTEYPRQEEKKPEKADAKTLARQRLLEYRSRRWHIESPDFLTPHLTPRHAAMWSFRTQGAKGGTRLLATLRDKGRCRNVAQADSTLAPATRHRRLRLRFTGIAKKPIDQIARRRHLALLRQQRDQGTG